ncbi:MAG: glycosyl hydrolase 53 family protein, partial [Verrucomicrobiota bacterium]
MGESFRPALRRWIPFIAALLTLFAVCGSFAEGFRAGADCSHLVFFEQLEQRMYDYNSNCIASLKAAGAMPEYVPVGNEIIGGLGIGICWWGTEYRFCIERVGFSAGGFGWR